MDGRHLDSWLATEPSQSERDAFGAKLYTISFRMYYAGRCNYADPHPGNYLFRDDGQVALLDFGCVPRYTEEEWSLLSEMDAAFYRDREHQRAVMTRYCDLDPDETADESRMSLLDDSFRWAVEPLLHRPFDFGDGEHLRIGIDVMARAIARRYTRANPVQVYLSRTLLGLRSLLHRMRARVDVRAIHARELRVTGWPWVREIIASGREL